MFGVYRHRNSYWSCSAFAGWVRQHFSAAPKPHCGTAEEWVAWRNKSREQNDWVYWFTESFLDDVQNFVMFPRDVMESIRIWFRNRFVTRTHLINTRLSKGKWHETDERLIHGLFELFCDFIELETAGMAMWNDENRKEYLSKLPWWKKIDWLNFKEVRSRELGIKHLEWAASLKHDEEWDNPGDPDYGQPTGQALAAKEQLALYLWWRDVRPKRVDPYEAMVLPNWAAGEDIMDFLSKEVTEADRAARDNVHVIEAEYEREDEEMLVRLIKLRHHLWT